QLSALRPVLDLLLSRHRPRHRCGGDQSDRRPAARDPQSAEAEMTAARPLLSIRNLETSFQLPNGLLRAVDNVSLDLDRGEILGLVGESGSGKSILGFSIMNQLTHPGRITGGSIEFDGVDLVRLPQEEMRRLRGKRIAMIFQDPMMTLNPVLRIDTQ